MVSIAFPATAWFANLFYQKRLHPVVLFILVVIGAYVLVVVSARVADAHLYAEMTKFDLDGDGGIGGAEQSPEADRAAKRWASDTGRTLAPIIGLPLSAIWVALCFSVLYAIEWVFRVTIFKKPVIDQSLETGGPSPPVQLEPVETTNPFQPPRSG